MLWYFPHSQALKTLSLFPQEFYSDLSFAEQRSGLSPFLIVSSLSLFAFGTNCSQTGLSSSSPASHYPKETSYTFPRKSSSFSSAFIISFTSTADTRHYKNTHFLHSHVCKGPSPTTVHRGQTPWVVSCQEGRYCLQGSSSGSHQPLSN